MRSGLSLVERFISKDLVKFHITARCNCKCEMCDAKIYMKSQNEMEFNDIKKVIDKVNAHYHRKSTFYITGGEPMLHPDLIETMAYMKEKGNNVMLSTTLSIFDDKILEKMPKEIDVYVSLHGPPGVHDRITGYNRLYEKAIDGMIKLRNHGCNILINCVISKYNVGRLKEFYNLIKKYQIPIEFQHLIWYPKGRLSPDLVIDGMQLDRDDIGILESEMDYIKNSAYNDGISVREFGLCGKDYEEHYLTFNNKKKGRVCGDSPVRIQPDGYMITCMGKILGSLLNDNLSILLKKRRIAMKDADANFKKGYLSNICVKCYNNNHKNQSKIDFLKNRIL